MRSVETLSAFRKSVGINSLTRTKVLTVLVEIEACINSNPLAFVGGYMRAKEPLTLHIFYLGVVVAFTVRPLKRPLLTLMKV